MNQFSHHFRRALHQIRAAPHWLQIVIILAAFPAAFWIYFPFLSIQCFFTVESHLHSQKWKLPATVYAQAPVLHTGLPWNSADLIRYLDRLDYHRQLPGASIHSGGEYAALGHDVLLRKRRIFLNEVDAPVVQVQFGQRGIEALWNHQTRKKIEKYELEAVPIQNLFGEEWEKRTLVSYRDIPVSLIQAVIAIEDRRFYKHHGIDLRGILRALWSNITEKKLVEGGSTITQQVAKNFFLSPERSIRRKLAEAIMARMLESRLTKEQILELYLNEIYLGQRGPISIKGVGEASRIYFRKDVQHVTVAEAALLAGMIRAPGLYNPYRHPEDARDRRNRVLAALREVGTLSLMEYEKYSMVPLRVYPQETRINLAPYLGDLVKNQLLESHKEEEIYGANLHIFTTLDLRMQELAESALLSGLEQMERRSNKKGKQLQGCLIAIEPATGYIRALVGGRDYSKSQFNRVTQAFRQTGSVFKPVVYAAALEEGLDQVDKRFTPASIVSDEPWTFRNSYETWEPANYDGQFHGPVTLRTALAHSLNVATARLAMEVGMPKVASLAKKIGFEDAEAIPSLALGTLEASPWQVARAFTVFAHQGIQTQPQTIRRITDSSGKTLEQNTVIANQILSPQTAFLITDMLRSALIYGTGASISKYNFRRPAAGKTGTTDEFRDAWFAGYTPNLLCVVWIGYDDNTPVGMNGATAALPIWARFMNGATEDLPVENFPVPSGILFAEVDPQTGKLATQNCPMVLTEMFAAGTEPRESCAQHHWTLRTWLSGPKQINSWNHHFRSKYRRSPENFLKKFSKKLHRLFRR